MLKLLTIISLLSTSIWADKIEDKILKYEKKRISKNRSIKLKDIKLFLKKDLKQNGWIGYAYDVSLTIKGKDIRVKDILFSNGTMISPELIDIKTNQSFKKMMYPTLSLKYSDEEFLIAGNKNSKHKIVVFSDPLCPNCIDIMPQLIKDVKKNPKMLSLYYIHMPLSMHPPAKTIVKASMIAAKQGIKNVTYKVYTANFEEHFDAYEEKDNKKVLKIFNKKLNTNITMKQINSKELTKELKHSLKLSDDAMVQGTPTVFFDGKIDQMRDKYLKYIK
jgi:thiol-disulfide isomerase/thioredoxin